MNSQIADEILEELASTFQKFETQSEALLQFVNDKGIAKKDDLAPYMERAAAASHASAALSAAGLCRER